MESQEKTNSATSSSLQITSIKDSLTDREPNFFAAKSPPTNSDVSKSSDSGRSIWSDSWASLLGASQLTLGVAMAVLAVFAIIHEASLANVASGLWGGAVAVGAGVAGILAGLQTFNNGRRREPSSPLAITVFLAASLIAFAVGNLVLVLAAIGLVRDAQRPSLIQNIGPNEVLPLIEVGLENGSTNWAPLLANLGLVFASSLECLAALVTSFKCYHLVCPCSKYRLETRHRQMEAITSGGPWIVSGGSKERRIANWVIQHTPSNSANVLLVPPPPPSTRVVTPAFLNPLLLTPPPQTILAARPSSRHSSSVLQDTRKSRKSRRQNYHRRMASASITCPDPPPQQPSPSEEELAKTYTGMDRDLAEEFISIAMDPSANNSNNTNSCADSCASLTTRS